MAEATKEKKPGRVAKFFRDYKSELKKITWCPVQVREGKHRSRYRFHRHSGGDHRRS